MKQIGSNLEDSSSLHIKVFKEIEKAILDGTFLPGDSLIESKLSNELGVSRTPIREALRQLELEGLVKNVPNKGVVVIGVSLKDIDDIYTIRMYIEGLCAKWAAENITDSEISELKEIVELQEFYSSKDDILQVWHLDKKFHEIIYESCRSRPLKHILSSFHNYIQKARELSFETSGRTKLAVKEHRDILEAIQKHDSKKAEELTIEHIKNAKNNILNNIKD